MRRREKAGHDACRSPGVEEDAAAPAERRERDERERERERGGGVHGTVRKESEARGESGD